MVYILLADGFEEVEAVSPADALRRARVETAFVGVTGMTVTASHGLRVLADVPLEDIQPEQCEAIIVPGGLRGVENILASEKSMEAIKAAHDAGALVCAICAGPTVLAKQNITDGKRAVCYPGMEDQMGKASMVPGATFIKDGKVITGRSAGTAWDFAFAILAALRGEGEARRVSDAVHYDHLQI